MTEIDQPIQRRPLTALFAERLYAGAGVWLLAGWIGPCNEPSPPVHAAEQTASAPVAAAPAATAKSAAPSAGVTVANPAAPAPRQTATTRHYMLTHYADTVGMRRALVAGKVADYQAAAAAVANDAWTPRLRGDYRPYLDAVREAARS